MADECGARRDAAIFGGKTFKADKAQVSIIGAGKGPYEGGRRHESQIYGRMDDETASSCEGSQDLQE